jgi:type I restriction enzyme S subunit
MNVFKIVNISDLGQTITGKTPSSDCPEDFGSEFMFITPSDNLDNKNISKSERYLSEIGINKLLTKKLPPKSILVSCIGSAMGKVTMNSFLCITNQQINSIRVNTSLYNSDYLYYCLKNNYSVLRNAAAGSTALPLLNKTDFDLIQIKIHKRISTQQKIAAVLSALDDKIELSNKINTELEAMAKTLYDYWFVQFDFPNANGKPYKSSGGKMVYNEILKRKVPEGWEVKKLADLISTDKSGDWGKEEPDRNYISKVECIRGTDINGINGKGEVKSPVRFILEKNEHKILSNLDLVVEISGGSPIQSTGRLAYITKEVIERFQNPLICSNFCKAISLKTEDSFFFFVYSWNRAYDHGVFFGYEGKTSGIKNLLFDTLVSNYHVPLPDKKLLKDFQLKVSLFERQRQKNLKQNEELSTLRDWLLPMLMNGQVSVGKFYEEEEEVLSMVAEDEVPYKIKIKL